MSGKKQVFISKAKKKLFKEFWKKFEKKEKNYLLIEAAI